jgi:hypothetical protein
LKVLRVYDVVYVAFVVCFGFGCVIVFPISVCDELHKGVSGVSWSQPNRCIQSCRLTGTSVTGSVRDTYLVLDLAVDGGEVDGL